MTEHHPEEPILNILRDVQADAREVVLHWREAYASLRAVPSEGAEARGLRTEMERLRDEYTRLIEEARHYGRERGYALAIAAPDPTLDPFERNA